MPVEVGLASDMPVLSKCRSSKLPLLYQTPSLYVPGSPFDGAPTSSPSGGWLIAYCNSPIHSAPLCRLKLVPLLLSGLLPSGSPSNTPASAVSDGVICPRTRTPSADSGDAGPPDGMSYDGSPGQPNIVLMKVAEYWLTMNSWSI